VPISFYDTNIGGRFKKLLVSALPPRFLHFVKKVYYVRAVPSFWEADFQPLRSLVLPDEIVVDIGANVGWYTNLLSRLVGGSGKVFSIEPIPETFNLLNAVIRGLGLRNVESINCGISETDTTALMEIPLWENGTPNLYFARVVPSQLTSLSPMQYTVSMRSMDSLFADGLSQKVTFIKCDVEGHELSVIKGARQFLERCKPAWLIEVSGNPDEPNSPARELFRRLEDHQYSAYWFNGQRLVKRTGPDQSTNYFFLQPTHRSRLAGLI